MNAKDIVSKEFETVKRGGYDAAEVDTFLKDEMCIRDSHYIKADGGKNFSQIVDEAVKIITISKR